MLGSRASAGKCREAVSVSERRPHKTEQARLFLLLFCINQLDNSKNRIQFNDNCSTGYKFLKRNRLPLKVSSLRGILDSQVLHAVGDADHPSSPCLT